MPRFASVPLAVLALVAGLLVSRAADAATYHGRNIDGRRYQASILSSEYGVVENIEVKFHDDEAFVYLRGGRRLVLRLEDEEIEDPHHIQAEDIRRGNSWEIDLKELVGR